MSPPFYADLGKASKDVFSKGYNFGLLKLDVKTKTETSVEFKFGGVQNLETKNVVGSLETKYKFKEYGVSFAEKWNTDNELSTEISIESLYDGLKVGCETSFVPKSVPANEPPAGADESPKEPSKERNEVAQQWFYSEKSLKLKSEYKNDLCALNIESLFKKTPMPVIKGGAVAGLEGWVIGGAAGVDTSKQRLTDYQFSMGYITNNFVINTTIARGMVFSASMYNQFNETVESSVTMSYAINSKDLTVFGIGCRWHIDADAVVRFKVDTKCMLGVGYSQKLREGISFSLSAMVSGKQPMEGNNNIGFSLELDA